MKSVTVDTISLRGAGVVSIAQPAKGPRFTLDSILLADFCRIKASDCVLEPGSGTGVISLLLAKRHPRAAITAVELDAEAASLCRRNVEANELEDRVTVMNGNVSDLATRFKAGSFDAIVANPPYRKEGSGRRSPLPSRHTARHEEAGDIREWLDLQTLLKNKGRFSAVFAADRTAELLSTLRIRKLEPKRLRFVHAYASEPASLVLVEAVRSARSGLEVHAPLIVHEAGGGYSDEVKEIYGSW